MRPRTLINDRRCFGWLETLNNKMQRYRRCPRAAVHRSGDGRRRMLGIALVGYHLGTGAAGIRFSVSAAPLPARSTRCCWRHWARGRGKSPNKLLASWPGWISASLSMATTTAGS